MALADLESGRLRRLTGGYVLYGSVEMDRSITIGRQFGSGGHEVGFRLSKKLGIPFYDGEIIVLTAKKSTLAESYLRKMEEKKPSFLNVGSAGLFADSAVSASSDCMINRMYSLSAYDKVFLEQSEVIKNLAKKEPCVIVGRASDYVLREMHSINVFLCADMKDRIARKLSLEGKQGYDEASMEKLVRRKDKARAKYYEYYTHERWGDSSHYDLCINTSTVGVDGAVNIILKYISEYGLKNIMPDAEH